MSNLHPVEFTLEERHHLVGELDNRGSTLRENGQQTEGAEFSAAFDELWEHTSHPTIDLAADTVVTVSLIPEHWSLLAASLDVSAYHASPRRPAQAQLQLRLRDRIINTLGDAFPTPAQPSAPQRRTSTAEVGEQACYWLFPVTHAHPSVIGYRPPDDAGLSEGDGLLASSHILTGTSNGTITVTAELLDGPPPLDTETWDDIAEYPWAFSTYDGDPPRPRVLHAAAPGHDAVALFEFDPVWPCTCMYRVRVSVHGRDAGTRDAGTGERHLIQAWRAPSAPAEMIKATDMTGARRRTGQDAGPDP